MGKTVVGCGQRATGAQESQAPCLLTVWLGVYYFTEHLLGIALVCAVSVGEEALQDCDLMTPCSAEGSKKEIVIKCLLYASDEENGHC